jgi:hypothetical protein
MGQQLFGKMEIPIHPILSATAPFKLFGRTSYFRNTQADG